MATVAGYAPTIVSFWPFMREFECPIWFEILAIGHTTSKTWFLTWPFSSSMMSCEKPAVFSWRVFAAGMPQRPSRH